MGFASKMQPLLKQNSLLSNYATVKNISDDITNNNAAIATNRGNIVNVSSIIEALDVSMFLVLD